MHVAERYRPVSVTSVACKLLEHIICKLIFGSKTGTYATTVRFQEGHSFSSPWTIYSSPLIAVRKWTLVFHTIPHERLLVLGKLA